MSELKVIGGLSDGNRILTVNENHFQENSQNEMELVGQYFNAYAKVSDQKSDGTGGGTFTSGAWQPRDINTEDSDTQNILSIDTNQILILVGTYITFIRCPALLVDSHKCRLQNITGAVTLLLGSNAFCNSTTGGHSMTDSILYGIFTITVNSVLEIQHRCATTSAGTGFGTQNTLGVNEIYTTAEFFRVT